MIREGVESQEGKVSQGKEMKVACFRCLAAISHTTAKLAFEIAVKKAECGEGRLNILNKGNVVKIKLDATISAKS